MNRTDYGSTTLGYSHSCENHDYHHAFVVNNSFTKLLVLELYAPEDEDGNREINPIKTPLDRFAKVKEVVGKEAIRAAIYKETNTEERSYGHLQEGNPGCFPFRYYEDYVVVADEPVLVQFKNKIRNMRKIEKKRLKKKAKALGLV